jgi:hypothetical protein
MKLRNLVEPAEKLRRDINSPSVDLEAAEIFQMRTGKLQNPDYHQRSRQMVGVVYHWLFLCP